MTDIPESKPSGDEMPLDVVSLETTSATNEAASSVLTGNENSPEAIILTPTDVPMEERPAELRETFALPTAAAPTLTEPGSPPGAPTLVLPIQTEAKTEKRNMIALFVRDEDMKELWERASKAKRDVISSINNASTAEELLNQIEYARNELLAGKENYEQAERLISEVEYRVAFNQRVLRLSSSWGLGLFIYETLWALGLLLFLFLVLGPAAFSSAAIPSSKWSSPDVVFLLGSMTWGALGGVIGAWLSLVKHISLDQDFDRQHVLWYINSPVMGIGVGAVIFLILRAGLLSITGPSEAINSPLVIYLLAWLSGFQQNVFTDMIRRLLQVFKIEGDGEGGGPTAVVRLPTETQSVESTASGRT